MCFVLIFAQHVVPGKDSKAEVSPASPVALVPEEKVSFSLCALSVSTLTVAKIRKVYNKLDSKAIAKQVRYTGTEVFTNIIFLKNCSVLTMSFCLNLKERLLKES